MPYVFPKRVLRDGDVLEPTDLNEDFIPVVEVVGGQLDAHNFKQGLSAADAAQTAFYRLHRKGRTVNPGFGLTPPFSMVQPIASAFSVPSDGGWHAIPLNVVDETFIDLDIGACSAWIDAQIQYAVPKEVFRAVNAAVGTPQPLEGTYAGWTRGVRVQFALRVDGAVLPWTITGHQDLDYASPRGEKAAVPYRIGSDARPWASDPGPRIDRALSVGMLGPPYGTVVVGDAVDLSAGFHRIEVVVRRQARLGQRTGFSDEDVVTIYSRKMSVLTAATTPRSAAALDSVEVVPFDSEDLIDQASMNATIKATRDKLNAVTEGMVARGGLRPEQLPSPWLGIVRNTRAITTWTNFSAVFPGWGNETTISATPSGTGWFEVDSANLRVSVSVLNTANIAQRVRVVVDLHVQELVRTPEASYSDTAQDIIGMLGIGVTNGGTTTVIQNSIGFFNSNNRKFESSSGPGDESRDHMNISLFTDYEVTADGTYEFSVFGCLVPTMVSRGVWPTITTSMETKNGSITAITLRDS